MQGGELSPPTPSTSHWPFNQQSQPLTQLGTSQHLLPLCPCPEICPFPELRRLSNQSWQNRLSTLSFEGICVPGTVPDPPHTSRLPGCTSGHLPARTRAQLGRAWAQQGSHGPAPGGASLFALEAVPVGELLKVQVPRPHLRPEASGCKARGPGHQHFLTAPGRICSRTAGVENASPQQGLGGRSWLLSSGAPTMRPALLVARGSLESLRSSRSPQGTCGQL